MEFLEEMQGAWTAARDALQRAQSTFERAYNKNHIPITFEIRDQVMINLHSLRFPDAVEGKGAKLTRRYEGPFKIIDKLLDVTYRLRIPHTYDIHPVISIAHIEKFTPSTEFGERTALPPLREETKSTQEYTVLEIVNERCVKRRGKYVMEYQCDWEGYRITNKWIPLKSLRNAQELLSDRKQKRKENTGRK